MTIDLDQYPEVLEDLFDKVADLLADNGVDPGAADEIAFALTEFVRFQWAGRNLYTKKLKTKCAEINPNMDLFAPVEQVESEESEHLIQLLEVITAELVKRRIGRAEKIATRLIDFIRLDFVKSRMYIPKGQKYELLRRDYAIWRKWDGSYAGKLRLLAEHTITEQRFYQIIKAIRKRHFKKVQPPLPGIAV